MKKKKLLLVSAISPFPQDSGGATRIKNTIQELSKYFDLYLITFANSPENDNLKKWCKKIIYIPFIDKKTIFSFIKFGQPYWFSNWYSKNLINEIKHITSNINFDHIQIEFSQLLYLIDYLDPQNQEKSIFTAHDISTISFYRRLLETKNIFKKIIHFFRFIEIYLYEKKYLPKYKQINVVSDNDKKNLSKLFKTKKIITVPNGIEKFEFLNNNPSDTIKLGYIGSFSHPPNKTAFLYFTNKIAPLLEKNKIKYQYYLAGNNNKIEQKNVINLGFVPNIKDFFNKIDILITPISAGSGSRIKILEALGFGKKILSSKIGAEGISVKTNLISICNNPQEYINEIKKFSKTKLDYNQEKDNLSNLTWEKIFKDYVSKI